jgi:probable F420-dependent oxidoreductase
MRAAESRHCVEALEAMGWGALWIPEGLHLKEAFSHAALLLGATRRLVVATGIANVWLRSPTAMISGAIVLGEAYPGRFVLGIGISHPESMVALGHPTHQPIAEMERYLDGMEAAQNRYLAPRPSRPVPVLLAALGPRMLRLASSRTAGAHPYFVPVEHTAFARETLGPEAFLAVEIGAVLLTDAEEARKLARKHMANPLSLGAYRRNLLRLGWNEADLQSGGSDALVDALVAWGDPDQVVARIAAHHRAGADHVSVQIYSKRRDQFPMRGYAAVAAAAGLT